MTIWQDTDYGETKTVSFRASIQEFEMLAGCLMAELLRAGRTWGYLQIIADVAGEEIDEFGKF